MGARYARKVDANQGEIVKALRSAYFKVHILHGTLDLLVGIPGSKKLVVMEVKADEKKKLKPSQTAFFAEWEGYPVYRVNSIADAFDVLGRP